MNWLIKTEPYVFSWDDLVKKGRADWDGVRNYQARNNLKLMKKGDLCLVYHSNEGLCIVGIAKITKEYFPDPTINDERWVAVEVKAVQKLKHPISLQTVKQDDILQRMVFARQQRLSVSPVTDDEFNRVLLLAGME